MTINEILADWDSVRVTHHGDLVAIAGTYRGVAHSGARTDGIGLARDLDKVAKGSAVEPEPEPAPVPAPAPEPEPTPDAVVFEEPAPEPVTDPELETLRARIA